MPRSAIIADDHEIIRQGLRQALARLPDLQVVGEAANGLEAIRFVKTLRPTLLLLDLAMPFSKGIEVFSEARRWSPKTKIIVFTGLTAHGLAQQLAQAEVDGMVLKRGPIEDLLRAVNLVLAGGRYFAPELAAMLAEHSEPVPLTPREMQILSLLATGKSSGQIAQSINISRRTVENHRANIMRKVGVNSIAGLMSYAVREGLLETARQV
ncbi:MAG: DNA-binding response regulator [Alphaproteobacteria bacterium]|nr:MAG: DNA-binding response regulator [Alphaproteobacteria bacterium]